MPTSTTNRTHSFRQNAFRRPAEAHRLDAYIRQQAEHTTEVALEVRKSAISLLDRIKHGLFNGARESTVALLEELQDGLRQLADERVAGYHVNIRKAKQLLKSLQEHRYATLDGRTLHLESAGRETTATGRVDLDVSAWDYLVNILVGEPAEVASGRYRIVRSTITWGAQTARMDPIDDQGHRVGQGLENLTRFADEVSCRVVGLLQAGESPWRDHPIYADLDRLRAGLATLSSHRPDPIALWACRAVSATTEIQRTGLLGRLWPVRRTVKAPLRALYRGGWIVDFHREESLLQYVRCMPVYIDATFQQEPTGSASP
ncbi:MAG TPA: hypothetical protein VGO93_24290 [Candidatus Xenobia bacterium]|jgi:hypothetical protein